MTSQYDVLFLSLTKNLTIHLKIKNNHKLFKTILSINCVLFFVFQIFSPKNKNKIKKFLNKTNKI